MARVRPGVRELALRADDPATRVRKSELKEGKKNCHRNSPLLCKLICIRSQFLKSVALAARCLLRSRKEKADRDECDVHKDAVDKRKPGAPAPGPSNYL